jgi:hypothetical protein
MGEPREKLTPVLDMGQFSHLTVIMATAEAIASPLLAFCGKY